MILAIIVFIIILALLVLVHEFGHYIVAKKSGMVVEEFGFGFPPRIFGIKRGGTFYSINWLPLGGFVKILGENNEGENNPRSFINRPFWARFLTLVAGVVMNFILAWVLLTIGFGSGLGLPTVVEPGQSLPAHASLVNPQITVLQVDPNSPAEKAGIKEGDVVVAVDHQHFDNVGNLISYVHSHLGQNLDAQLARGNQNLEVSVYARPNAAPDQGAIGVALGDVGRLSFPWYEAPAVGLRATWTTMEATFAGFYHLISSGQGVSQLGGPVKIAVLTKQVTQLGLVYIIQFAAFLSINLGIINILPFPALDGGRVLFLLIEKVRGKRNNQTVEQWANTIGFVILIGLILLITVHDITFLVKH